MNAWHGLDKRKPDAEYQARVDRDQLSFYKTGRVVDSEWFLDGKRLPGGDHEHVLPVGLHNGSPEAPELPDLKHTTDFHDNCRCQYDTGKVMGACANSKELFSVAMTAVKKVPSHGKCMTDTCGKEILRLMKACNARFVNEPDLFADLRKGSHGVARGIALEHHRELMAAKDEKMRQLERRLKSKNMRMGKGVVSVNSQQPAAWKSLRERMGFFLFVWIVSHVEFPEECRNTETVVTHVVKWLQPMLPSVV